MRKGTSARMLARRSKTPSSSAGAAAKEHAAEEAPRSPPPMPHVSAALSYTFTDMASSGTTSTRYEVLDSSSVSRSSTTACRAVRVGFGAIASSAAAFAPRPFCGRSLSMRALARSRAAASAADLAASGVPRFDAPVHPLVEQAFVSGLLSMEHSLHSHAPGRPVMQLRQVFQAGCTFALQFWFQQRSAVRRAPCWAWAASSDVIAVSSPCACCGGMCAAAPGRGPGAGREASDLDEASRAGVDVDERRLAFSSAACWKRPRWWTMSEMS